MKVTITVRGPLGIQEISEHKNASFKTCIQNAADDLHLIAKHMDHERQKTWEKLEKIVERH